VLAEVREHEPGRGIASSQFFPSGRMEFLSDGSKPLNIRTVQGVEGRRASP
jgi:hypothetical protein